MLNISINITNADGTNKNVNVSTKQEAIDFINDFAVEDEVAE